MEPKNERQMRELMERVVANALPKVLRTLTANIQLGQVIEVNSDTGRVGVRILGNGSEIKGIKFHKGAGSVIVNDTCLVLSTDPKLRTNNFAVIF